MKSRLCQHLIILAVLISALYGSSYQQFRHFDRTDPRGANDSASYLEMSHGNYDVRSDHRYRFIVPALAGALQPLIGNVVQDPIERDNLSFYVVNFGFMAAAGWLFYQLLIAYGFSWQLALIGLLFFCCNRIAAFSTGTPMVDSAYYFAIVFTLFCVQQKHKTALALAMPLLVLTKETTFPFLVLGWALLRKRERALDPLDIGLAAAVAAIAASRHFIGGLATSEGANLFEIVLHRNLLQIPETLAHLFSLSGLHDLQTGYALLFVLAIIGWWLHRKEGPAVRHEIPPAFLLVIPLTLVYVLISMNLGRMLFAACFVVIPYALVAIDYVMENRGIRVEEPVRGPDPV